MKIFNTSFSKIILCVVILGTLAIGAGLFAFASSETNGVFASDDAPVPSRSPDEQETLLLVDPDECDHLNVCVKSAVEPTCTEPGYTGNTVCVDCAQIQSYGELRSPLGHDYRDRVTGKPYYISAAMYLCSRCNDNFVISFIKATKEN